MRLRENEEDAFAKHLKTTKQEMNSTPIRTREAVKENVLSNSGEPIEPLNTSKTINRKKSMASKTCANHLESQADFKIVIDGQNFHYCPKCAAHLASNGFQVERIASKSPVKSRERPPSAMYKSPQNSRKTELNNFLGLLKHLQEGFKQKNEAMEKVAVSYEVEKITISNVYASMVEYIEYVRDEHLKFLDDSAERNVETCRVASGELFDALEEISAIREDIESNMGKILTKELDEESYSECMGFYKQKHSMLEQRLEDLGEEAQPIVLTTSEAVDEKLEAFKEFFDDLTGLRNSKY